ncbi:26185_t:CDS:2, partial [Gigaspora rosea]
TDKLPVGENRTIIKDVELDANKNYSKEKRSQITKLDISGKDLEGLKILVEESKPTAK